MRDSHEGRGVPYREISQQDEEGIIILHYFLCLSVENDYKITFRRSAECIGTTRNRAWEFNLILLLIG